MPSMSRVRLAWSREGRSFEALEPDADLVERHADTLRAWYNAAENASMMTGSGTMTREDVLDFWRGLREGAGRGFLSFVDGDLVGDMDIRNVRGRAGEFAIMIGAAATKGRGLGKVLGQMIHVHAFRDLDLERVYVCPRTDNTRVLRLEAFLGYAPDDSAEARVYGAGEVGCRTYSLSAAAFRERHAVAWRDVAMERRLLTTRSRRGTSPPESGRR
jgi:RimJ/RimL family protein N-acetyltransferase